MCRFDSSLESELSIGRAESFRDSIEYSMNPELQKVIYCIEYSMSSELQNMIYSIEYKLISKLQI